MKISINILTWNNKSTILKMLQVLEFEMKGIEHEYIFVDNGSDDGTAHLIQTWVVTHLAENFKFIFNKENLGISKGKNQGIDASNGEYIMMLDGDVVPVRNSILLLMKWLNENKEKHAIGMYPNKFSPSEDHAEPYCNELVEPKKHKCCCLFYGMYRASIFKDGLRMSEEGEFGKAGYGWEDHDFFKRMQEAKIDQYVAYINNPRAKYYHAINSSIRAMGHQKYQETSRERNKLFKQIWGEKNATGQSADKSS